MTSDPDVVRERYRRFAEEECRGYSELYAALANAVASSLALTRFVAAQPDTQPNLFLGAVQYLTGPKAMPCDRAGLEAFVSDNADDVASLMRTHHTQTNEVGRCAAIMLALPPGPLALIELGSSAGLCLMLDRFYYELGSARVGDAKSPVTIRCAVTGPAPIPAQLPDIAWRRGLDIDPVDVRDQETARWLLALIWADHPERRRRLQEAIEMAKREPPELLRGDLLDSLPALVAEAPESAHLVIFHTAVAPYVPHERWLQLRDLLAHYARRREVTLISYEGDRKILAAHPSTALQGPHPFLLERTTFSRGAGGDEALALGHPHGWSLEWMS